MSNINTFSVKIKILEQGGFSLFKFFSKFWYLMTDKDRPGMLHKYYVEIFFPASLSGNLKCDLR